MTTPLKHYLATIEAALKAGNATEHTHRPTLKALLESMDLGLTATNEPKRIACGAPDYILTRHDLIVGYIEAKDVGKALVETERSEQLKRYRRALDNLVLTDYLEFRWYVGGELRQEARLAQPQPGGKLKPGKDGLAEVESLLRAFLAHQPQNINTPKELAERLARLTHIIRDIIITAFEADQASPLLQGWRDAFARVLLADLSLPERTPDFADMFAQTLAYGLFTARVMQPHPPTPSPLEGRGSDSPSPQAERGLGGEVRWQTSPELWLKLKPLARQMRREPTPAEDKLWQRLRNRQLLDLKFRRQHTIDRFIVDFYCREARLIIEVDGPIHDYTQAEDAIRQEFLESQGYRVLRFSNTEVVNEVEAVLERIAHGVQPHPPRQALHAWQPSPLEGRGGEESSPSPQAERRLGGEVFTRQEAQYLIPKSNPFLRDFFIQISGPQLDDEPFASFVDDLVNLLAHTDMAAVLADFGRRTRQEDPVVHFYETFLAAYDPRLREARGVYYTPEPVVSYIVRSVDALLKSRFACPQGLAEPLPLTPSPREGRGKGGGVNPKAKSRQVFILDPATGTGTFLYAVIDHIRQQFMQQGDAGLWPGYVKHHLLPRLFGFELLMAPYAVAHFKLSLQLAGRDLPEALRQQWAYLPAAGERLGVYLTNALEEPHEMTGLPLFTQWVADETNAANEVKRHLPVLVVMGNPPYSVSSSNKSPWIEGLMESYKKAVRSERNIQPLSDDYIKFIRLAHDRIERTEQGIIGIITNHAYLSGLIHRGMREELMKTFTDIYVLNLHGNATIGETAPDGSADENVFDIRQGVAIALFVKEKKQQEKLTQVKFFELWGKREGKYEYLRENDVVSTDWQPLTLQAPHYFFVPKDFNLEGEYKTGWSIPDIFPISSLGIEFGSKQYLLSFDADTISNFVEHILLNPQVSDNVLSEQYQLKTTSGWRLQSLRHSEFKGGYKSNLVVKCTESPFNIQYTYHSPMLRRPQLEVLQNLYHPNVAILTLRQSRTLEGGHFFAVNTVYSKDAASITDRTTGFPLYLYPTGEAGKSKGAAVKASLPGFEALAGLEAGGWSPDAANGGRVPNLNPAFVQAMAEKLGLTFQPDLTGLADLSGLEFGPEDIFHYIYAIFHAPTYRRRYAEFLKIDFPRVPLTSDVALFRTLGRLGQELVSLHLLDFSLPLLDTQAGLGRGSEGQVRFPIGGDNRVEKSYPKYTPPLANQPGRVYLNPGQYFEGIAPEVWGFYVGGYQPLEKWLKDRQGRQLSYDELTHYRQMVAALGRTIEVMAEIEAVIPQWPLA